MFYMGTRSPKKKGQFLGGLMNHCKVIGHYGELSKRRLNRSRYRLIKTRVGSRKLGVEGGRDTPKGRGIIPVTLDGCRAGRSGRCQHPDQLSWRCHRTLQDRDSWRTCRPHSWGTLPPEAKFHFTSRAFTNLFKLTHNYLQNQLD